MRLEELKNEMPEVPAYISNMIAEKVNEQTSASNAALSHRKNKIKWSLGKIASAAAICIAATSTMVYAGAKLYQMHIEKNGTYSVEVSIDGEDGQGAIDLPEKVSNIRIEAGYIPQGMEWVDEGIKLSYSDTPNMGGISISSVLLDEKNPEYSLVEKNIVESEERAFGTMNGVYLRYNDMEEDKSFNQRIYLFSPEEYRVIMIYIGDDVSKDEAMKFAENIQIVSTDEMVETENLYKWSDFVNPEEEYVGNEIIKAAMPPMHQVGETFLLGNAFGEDASGEYIETDKISVCVDSVITADDLKLLEGKEIPEEWRNVVGEDGKLVDNHLSYIKKGDGVESLDTVVSEETAAQKLVYATVTYTNTSDVEINHLLYLGSLMTLIEEDGKYSIYAEGMTPGEGYDYRVGDSVANAFEMTYFGTKEDYGNGGNYISSLKSGESIQVDMAWIVNETDLENLYLNLTGSGSCFQFGEQELKTGLVDLELKK